MSTLDEDSYTGKTPSHILYKERFNKEKVVCEICERPTQYDATKRCDGCWDMEKGLRMLVDKDKNKAIKWLENNLKLLKGK